MFWPCGTKEEVNPLNYPSGAASDSEQHRTSTLTGFLY